MAPRLMVLLLAMLYPPCARAATPPTEPAARPGNDAAAVAADAGAAEPAPGWTSPPLRIMGVLAYEVRREQAMDTERTQKGSSATLNLSSRTWIWEPWLAQVDGTLNVTMARDKSDGYEAQHIKTSSNQSVILTGSARLAVLPQSAFPFEAHIDRNNSRVSSELALANGYASQRFGFSQHYLRPEGDTMIAWDRNVQTSAGSGRNRQDSLQLNAGHLAGNHRFQLTGDANRTVQEHSGESVRQRNVALQHGYSRDGTLTIENMANVSGSGFKLRQGENRTALAQLSSMAMWRPEDQDLTLMLGARWFGMDIESIGLGTEGASSAAAIRSANLNGGLNYDLSETTRIHASVNRNSAVSSGRKNANASQTVGANYQAPQREFGDFRYNWAASGQAANRSGGQDQGRQLAAQLSHGLGRSMRLSAGSAFNIDASQSIALVANTGGEPTSRQLTNSASMSWDTLSEDGTAAALRMSASDTRALERKEEFFQMINLQAQSNLTSGAYGAWSGSLTIQSVRQSAYMPATTFDPLRPAQGNAPGKGFVTTSSGSITYQNERMFGISRLHFTSDLRLNAAALLPLLGSGKDQETAAWENRFDYLIGRTHLRLNFVVSRSSTPAGMLAAPAGGPAAEPVQRTTRALLFSLSRGFGNF